MTERITVDQFDEKVNKATLPVLVDFYSDTCIPCKKMAGVIAKIEDELKGKAFIYKVNTNYEKELVEQYSIQAAPTFIVFKSGEEKTRLTGIQKKEILISKLLEGEN